MRFFRPQSPGFIVRCTLPVWGTLLVASPALAADTVLAPTVAVSEEYNDNVLDAETDRKSDFIMRLQPGVAAKYRAPSLKGEFVYNFDYHHYARRVKEDEENHYLALNAMAEVIDNFFFVDFSDTRSRVSLDVARNVTTESLYANQTDENKARVSPYLLWRVAQNANLQTGYRFLDTSYWGEGIDRREHTGFAELAVDAVARLSITAGYSFGSIKTDITEYLQHDLKGGFRYEYGDKSFLFGGIGNSWQNFRGGGGASNLFWQAGVSREMGKVTASLETRVDYLEDPLAVSTKRTSYDASLKRALQHGEAGISTSYTKYLDTLGTVSGRRKADVTGYWRAEMSPRLEGSLYMTADRVTGRTATDHPYHFSGNAGVSYLFNYDVTASLNYGYIDYRRELDSSAGARQTNRIVLTVKKMF